MNELTRTERRRQILARLNSRFRAVLRSFDRVNRRTSPAACVFHAAEMAESLAAYLDEDTCECGSGLARVLGGGIDAALCPVCDEERLHELATD